MSGRKKQYGAMIVTTIREALGANKRLTIRELIKRFDMGYGTMHRIFTGDLQMSKVILSYKFDFYMMHVAKVSDHSCNIVNHNNQFKEMWFRSLQELRAATSRFSNSMDSSDTRTCSNSGSIAIAVMSPVKDIFKEKVNILSRRSALKFIH